MPETLTQRMARYQRAVAAGDLDAAARIANEPIQPPAPRHAPRVATVATFPELAKLDQASYSAICADATRLASEVRQWKAAAQTSGQRAADFERRLNQSLARIAELDPARASMGDSE